jgi:hypothetical protein
MRGKRVYSKNKLFGVYGCVCVCMGVYFLNKFVFVYFVVVSSLYNEQSW